MAAAREEAAWAEAQGGAAAVYCVMEAAGAYVGQGMVDAVWYASGL